MSLRDAIAALVAAAPVDATIPVRWLAEQLKCDAAITDSATRDLRVSVDLTVDQLAVRLNRGASTIRTWLANGDLPGAYRNHGREWRIPVTAVEAMQRAEAQRHVKSAAAPAPAAAELSDWRRHLPMRKAQ
jgi:excisionase family DNA binding protein